MACVVWCESARSSVIEYVLPFQREPNGRSCPPRQGKAGRPVIDRRGRNGSQAVMVEATPAKTGRRNGMAEAGKGCQPQTATCCSPRERA